MIPTYLFVIPTRTPTNEANAEMERNTVIAETKTRKYLKYVLKFLHTCLYTSLVKSLCFISYEREFPVSTIFFSRKPRFIIFVFKVFICYVAILFRVVRRK